MKNRRLAYVIVFFVFIAVCFITDYLFGFGFKYSIITSVIEAVVIILILIWIDKVSSKKRDKGTKLG